MHPVASTSPNLEEECEKMLGDGACRFFLGAHQLASLHSTPLRVRLGEFGLALEALKTPTSFRALHQPRPV